MSDAYRRLEVSKQINAEVAKFRDKKILDDGKLKAIDAEIRKIVGDAAEFASMPPVRRNDDLRALKPSLGLVVAPSKGRPNLSKRSRSTIKPVGGPLKVLT